MDVVHPVAHDQLGALVELLDEAGDLGEVVGEVGIGHHDVAALSGGEAAQVGASVAALGLVDDVGARRPGQLGAPVLGVVVGDDHLARQARGIERTPGTSNALLDVLRLVQARDHNRDRRNRRLGEDVLAALSLDRAHTPPPGRRHKKETFS